MSIYVFIEEICALYVIYKILRQNEIVYIHQTL